MAGLPLTDQQRADILDDIRDTAGTTDGSVRRIAARHSVGMGTVRRLAADNDLQHAWRDGAWRTEAANTQKATHLSERRNQLQADLLDDIEEVRDRFLNDVTHLNVVKVLVEADPFSDKQPSQFTPTVERVERTVLPPGPRDLQSMMGAITNGVRQVAELARLEAVNTGSGEAANMLGEFFGNLRVDYTERHGEPPPGEPPVEGE